MPLVGLLYLLRLSCVGHDGGDGCVYLCITMLVVTSYDRLMFGDSTFEPTDCAVLYGHTVLRINFVIRIQYL
ncbi:hypothetical protein BDQ17DRAFT_1364244 [Cyathus striatus]|nr:hypothetical protein BDQ17DRAFT_1364244 [Cyathus striatus]